MNTSYTIVMNSLQRCLLILIITFLYLSQAYAQMYSPVEPITDDTPTQQQVTRYPLKFSSLYVGDSLLIVDSTTPTLQAQKLSGIFPANPIDRKNKRIAGIIGSVSLGLILAVLPVKNQNPELGRGLFWAGMSLVPISIYFRSRKP